MRFLEKYIKNEQSLKRLKRFNSRQTAVGALYLMILLIVISAAAEMVANNKPVVASYNGSLVFPVFKRYHPSLFGQQDQFVTDYRKLSSSLDWALWPAIQWGPNESNKNVDNYPSPPSRANLLGTDDRGRDVLTRLIYGFRNSFRFAVSVWLLASLIGVALGAFMAYAGGVVDLIGQRFSEIIETSPFLIILIMLGSIFTLNLNALIIFVAIFQWMIMAAYTRAEVLRLRKREFVESARASGASHARIIFMHILPNAMGPVITFAPFLIAANVSTLAVLDYLGFGLQAPAASWGELLRQAQSHILHAWWLVVYPSLAIIFTVLILNLIGDAVRDALDPRR